MSLVSDFIVTGIRGGNNALGRALGGGVTSAIGGGGGMGGSGYAPRGSVRETEAERAARLAEPTTVAPVDVIGAAANVPGALNQVIGSALSTIPGAVVPSTAATPAAPGGENSAPTELEDLTVVAPRKPPGPTVDTSAFPGPIAGLTFGQPNFSGLDDGAEVTDLERPEPELGVDDLLLPAAGVGAIAGLTAGGPSGNYVTGSGDLPFGIQPTDLIATGLLGAGLLGGTGGTGSAGEGLKGLADSSANLANRLGNIATAGFAGDIGGRGLNAIARMVRKAQASIRQRYSSMGMSGSTAEMQDLNAAAEAGVDLQFKVGQEMAQTGLNAIAALTGQSAQIYTALLNATTAKNTALGNAIANFAGSLVR